MSSSKKKQLRKEQYMTERQAAAAAEAKKLKRYTLTFWVVIALVACIFVGAIAVNPIKNVVYKNTDAIQVGDHTLTSVELNYFYIDAVNAYVNQYSSYISYILDTSKPLDEQVTNKETGATWADDFLDSAKSTIRSTYAMYDLAVKNGHELSEDEQKSLESTMTTMSLYAQIYGYSNLTSYLRSVYGNGSTEETYREYLRVSALANSYYSAYSDSLEYSDEDIANYKPNEAYTFNSYTFASYYLSATKFREGGTKDDEGNTTYTDDEKKAAIEACKKAADELAAGNYEKLDDFNKAIQELDKKINNKETSTASATENEKVLYSKVNSLFQDWLIGKVEKEDAAEDAKDEDKYEFVERKEGELTVIEYSSGSGDSKVVNGYYVLRFGGFTSNDYALKNVRHLLVKFEGGTYNSTTQTTTYTDEEKAKAKTEAEKLLADWVAAGDLSEDSFAALAKKESDDNADEGGLYEDVYPGQMVEEFEDWCYDDNRKVGDYGIIESPYGYHIMFFVGNSDTTYRNYMITNTLRSEELEEWHTEQTEAIKLEVLTEKHVKKDLVLA